MCAIALAGCGPAAASRETGTFQPPPPLALVAIVDPAPAEAASELRQLASLIEAGATPSQAIVVRMLAGAPSPLTAIVRSGDSLSAIASAHGVPLAALQDANPQLGPLVNRQWGRVFPGDRVIVPAAGAPAPGRDVVVSRAPAGPPPPSLLRPPDRPPDPTTFQGAQYRHAVAAAESANRERVAAWRARAARELGPWQARVGGRLRELAARLAAAPAGDADDHVDVAAAVREAVDVLGGLPGRRVLVLLAGGRVGPDEDAALTGAADRAQVVIGNLPDPAVVRLASGVAGARAAVTALDPALTELQLARTVNG